MSSTEETVWILRIADQATRPLAAVRDMWTNVAGAATSTAAAMRSATRPIEQVRSEVGKATGTTEAAAAAVRSLRQRLDDLATGGRLGGFIQDLALGRSATAALRDALGMARKETKALEGDAKSLGDRFRDLGQWIKAGLGIDIGMTIGRTIRGWLDDLVHALPNAIAAGHQYAQMIDDIVDSTGMSAQAASLFVGLLERTGLTAGEVDRTLAIFGRNLAQSEDLFKQLGIATRDASGDMLDAYTILTNTRRAFAEHGAQLLATGAAQELFGRTGYKLLDFLQLTDEQVRAYTDDLARMGLILDESTIDSAQRFTRQLERVGQVVQGIQTTVFAALGPSLEHFVDAFASFVRDNLNQIVSFVVNVANFVMGVIGGLLGLDFAAKTTEQAVAGAASATAGLAGSWNAVSSAQQKAKAAADAISDALERQIKAIDREIDAIRRRAEARQAANQREQLALELARAQEQLADLRGNKPYVEGLSNAQAQLALQKHAQDLEDARKAVRDAKGGLADFDADQSDRAQIDALQRRRQRYQEELAAHKKKVQEQAALETGLKGDVIAIDDALVAKSDSMFASITAAAQEWRDNGVAFAADLKAAFGGLLEVILGTEHVEMTGHGLFSYRSGGILGALGGVAGAMDLVKGAGLGLAAILGVNLLSSVVGLLGPVRNLAIAAVGAIGPLGLLIGLLLSVKGDSTEYDAREPGRDGQKSAGQQDIDWMRRQDPNKVYDYSMFGTYGGVLRRGMTYREAIEALIAAGFGHAKGGWAGLNGPEISVLGDGGEPELVVPKSRLERIFGGRREIVNHIHVHIDSRQVAEVVDRIFDDDAGNAPVPLGASGVA